LRASGLRLAEMQAVWLWLCGSLRALSRLSPIHNTGCRSEQSGV